MKVKTIVLSFRDRKEKVNRKLNEEFIVSKERFEEINSTKHGKLVEEVVEKKKTKKE